MYVHSVGINSIELFSTYGILLPIYFKLGLMLKRRLSLLLILLIASQSGLATLDFHPTQQSERSHYIIEHQNQHSHEQHDVSAEGYTPAHHHHCHSHNSQFHFLSDSIPVPLNINKVMFNTAYTSASSSAPLSNLFRPPRT